MAISAAELAKLVSTAVGSAAAAEDGDSAEAARAVDVLKQLAKSDVTADLLRQTEAGKKVNKLAKCPVADVAQAAQAAVQAWKESVKKQHGAAAAPSGGDKPKQQADAKPAALQRSGSGAAPSPSPAAAAEAAGLDLAGIKGFPPSYAEPIRKNACKMFAEGLAMALSEAQDVELADPGMVRRARLLAGWPAGWLRPACCGGRPASWGTRCLASAPWRRRCAVLHWVPRRRLPAAACSPPSARAEARRPLPPARAGGDGHRRGDRGGGVPALWRLRQRRVQGEDQAADVQPARPQQPGPARRRAQRPRAPRRAAPDARCPLPASPGFAQLPAGPGPGPSLPAAPAGHWRPAIPGPCLPACPTRPPAAAAQVQPEELIGFEPEQMASRARQQENSKIRAHMAAEAVRGQSQQASTDQFQ
jgi:hypothetical protein